VPFCYKKKTFYRQKTITTTSQRQEFVTQKAKSSTKWADLLHRCTGTKRQTKNLKKTAKKQQKRQKHGKMITFAEDNHPLAKARLNQLLELAFWRKWA